jgi:uncharacterized membrane-anchored protein YjiN (DUF445 family)
MAERIFHDGHHHKLVDLLVDRAADWVDDNHETVTHLVSDRSPTWVPQFVDGLVGDKVYVEILKFVRAVQADPNHQVRQSIDKYLNDLAQDLQHDPVMIARAEDIKAQVLGDPEVRELASRTWGTVKNALLGAVDDPDSELTVKFKAAVITDTVARWDAEETSQKIELQVGKDLQFIRINGTVVGALAGLAIFTVAHLIFG